MVIRSWNRINCLKNVQSDKDISENLFHEVSISTIEVNYKNALSRICIHLYYQIINHDTTSLIVQKKAYVWWNIDY